MITFFQYSVEFPQKNFYLTLNLLVQIYTIMEDNIQFKLHNVTKMY